MKRLTTNLLSVLIMAVVMFTAIPVDSNAQLAPLEQGTYLNPLVVEVDNAPNLVGFNALTPLSGKGSAVNPVVVEIQQSNNLSAIATQQTAANGLYNQRSMYSNNYNTLSPYQEQQYANFIRLRDELDQLALKLEAERKQTGEYNHYDVVKFTKLMDQKELVRKKMLSSLF